jgi:putative hydrolase of the HAD superfamily
VIEAVLFDVDGVLVHPWRWRDVLERVHRITPEMTRPFFRGPFLDCLVGRADLMDLLPPFLASWGWTRSVAEFVGDWLVAENAPDHLTLAVVTEVRDQGIPCFVASTQERHRARYLSREMALDQRFDGLFFSCDVGVAKPNASFFEIVAQRLGRSPSELLFFDDVEANVEGARSAGWRAEQFTTVQQLRQDLRRHLGSR